MIIVNLKGGLGNQMFQYALGLSLSLKNKEVLKLDVDGLERANRVGDIYRPFDLAGFSISATIATAKEIRELKYPYGTFSKAQRWLNFKLSKDKNVLFRPQVLEWIGDIYLDGFWQSPKYFENIRQELLAEFLLKQPLSSAALQHAIRIKETNSVALHVRRGDYVKNARVQIEFGSCTNHYYDIAMKHINRKVHSPTFFIFSDDIDWVKNNLSNHTNVVYVKNPAISTAEELALMSICKHNIIANSTFSWWSAWLNQNPDKIVVTPTPWFNKIDYDQSLIPESWIKISKQLDTQSGVRIL